MDHPAPGVFTVTHVHLVQEFIRYEHMSQQNVRFDHMCQGVMSWRAMSSRDITMHISKRAGEPRVGESSSVKS